MANKSVKKAKKGNKRFQFEMTSLGMLFWGCGLFFLLAWIFVLGILVGRGFLPGTVNAISDLKKQISRLQAMVNHRSTEEKMRLGSAEPDPKLAFYEKLSSKKDEAKKKFETAPEPEGAGVPVPGKEEEATVRPSEKEAVSHGPGPSSRVKETRESPGQTGEPGDEMRYTVQIASVTEKGKAEGLIARLVKKGYPAYFYEAEVKGKTYYRVRCGRFVERPEAAEYAKKLEKEERIKGFVTRIE